MLTQDIVTLVGLQLDWESIKKYSLTCHKINNTLNSIFFWYRKLEKEFPEIDLSNVSEYKKFYYYLSRRLDKESTIDFIFGYTVLKFFPSFCPNYYLPHTNIFKVEYRKMQEIYKNIEYTSKTSFLIGRFFEIYRVIFKTNSPENFLKDIEILKNLAYAARVRFIDGIIIINLQDTFESVF